MRFPYTYDCWIQRLISGKVPELEKLRELLQRNREKDSVSGEKNRIIPAPRKVHKEFIEKAVKDSYELAMELGVDKPVVRVAEMYSLSYERVKQIVKERSKS